VRVGECFVECAGKTGFPGFGFFRQGEQLAPCGGEDGSQRKGCNSPDQRMALAVYCQTSGSQMEIPVEEAQVRQID